MKGTFPVEALKGRPTPFYFYDLPLLDRTLGMVRKEICDHPQWRVHYAVKANANPGILRRIAAAGLGADCVSGGEIRLALEAGFAPEDIVYAGVGKSDWEIELALEKGISRFNVESTAELQVIDEIAGRMGKVAPVCLRVNPNVHAHTHPGITTGMAENKFGIYYGMLPDAVKMARSLSHVRFCGLHFHIGSQILDMVDFEALCGRINALQDHLDRLGIPVGELNVGGGLGIDYEHPNEHPVANFPAYFAVFRKNLKLRPGQALHFELGRSLVAPCGSLICRVLYVKQGATRQFAVVDGSMTELIRPALYHAVHWIENLTSDQAEQKYDVVGPVCESSDVFGKGVKLNACRRGDLLAIRSAGAYGESMASGYNGRPLPGSVLYSEE